jgi:hypothetical protein
MIPATAAHADSTYPVDVNVVWTNLSGTATKSVTATVSVRALGTFPVSGTVQICEDTRCYGDPATLDPATGSAALTAIVPRDAAGVKSLQVVYSGDGVVQVPGYGATTFKARAGISAQTEASIGRYTVVLNPSSPYRINTANPVHGQPVSITFKVVSNQPKTMFQYVNGVRVLLSGDDRPRVWGDIRVQQGSTVLYSTYLAKEAMGSITFAFTPKTAGTYTLRIKYAGSEYFSPVVTPTFDIVVK